MCVVRVVGGVGRDRQCVLGTPSRTVINESTYLVSLGVGKSGIVLYVGSVLLRFASEVFITGLASFN